jgi:transposase
VTVGKWRSRFIERRLGGLADEDRPGRPRVVTGGKMEEEIARTLEEETPLGDDNHWSTGSMATATGMPQTTVSRIWRAFEPKPRREQPWRLSSDPPV